MPAASSRSAAFFTPLAVISHRVLFARKEQNGQILGQAVCPGRAVDVAVRPQKVAVGACGKGKGAEGVGVVSRDHRAVPGQPGVGRRGVVDALVVAPEAEIPQQRRCAARAAHKAQHTGKALPGRDRGRRPACAAQHQAFQRSGVAFGKPAGKKASHAVPQQHQRKRGVGSAQGIVDLFQVGKHQLAAVFFGKKAEVARGFSGVPVAQVVVRAHQNAVTGHPSGKPVVAAGVFAHAVGELQKQPGVALGAPDIDVHVVYTIGRKKRSGGLNAHGAKLLSCRQKRSWAAFSSGWARARQRNPAQWRTPRRRRAGRS